MTVGLPVPGNTMTALLQRVGFEGKPANMAPHLGLLLVTPSSMQRFMAAQASLLKSAPAPCGCRSIATSEGVPGAGL